MTEWNTLKVKLAIKGEIFPRASAELKKSIGSILGNFFKKGNFLVEIEIISPKRLKQLNLKYRGKEVFGEVLSFPLFKNKKEIKTFFKSQKAHPFLLGTICLCPSFIKKNLRLKSQKEYEGRVLELVCHSTCHLIGIHQD